LLKAIEIIAEYIEGPPIQNNFDAPYHNTETGTPAVYCRGYIVEGPIPSTFDQLSIPVPANDVGETGIFSRAG
jgi:hypothetical protein